MSVTMCSMHAVWNIIAKRRPPTVCAHTVQRVKCVKHIPVDVGTLTSGYDKKRCIQVVAITVTASHQSRMCIYVCVVRCTLYIRATV